MVELNTINPNVNSFVHSRSQPGPHLDLGEMGSGLSPTMSNHYRYGDSETTCSLDFLPSFDIFLHEV